MIGPMLTRSCSVLLICVLTATPGAAQEERAAPSADQAAKLIDGVFATWDRPDSPGMSVAVIHDGRIIYERGFGMANLEHGVPNGPDTIFRIGSTSKQFTAACVAMLALQGRLDLDADVRTILPELPAWETPVTIRNLIHHTSGIPDYVGMMVTAGHELEDHVTPSDTMEVLAAAAGTLDFAPGSRFAYSNSNYFLMSQVVERVSGQSLRDFAREHVFEPLGMDRTHYHDRFNEVVVGRADGYIPDERGGWLVSNTCWEQVGDGGVFTTVRDMAKWDAFFYDNSLEGGEELVSMLSTTETPADDAPGNGGRGNYAFGLMLTEEDGRPTVSHGGSWVGFRADMVRLPEQKLTVVVLSNCATADPSRLARSVLKMLL